MEVGRAAVPRVDQERVQARLALRRAGPQRLLARAGHLLRFRRVVAREVVEDRQRVRADVAVGVAGGHFHQHLRDLRMREALQRFEHFDADVRLRIGEHLAEGVERARIANAPERFDRRPADVGVVERGDERLDGARVFQTSEGVGGGDADPPVGILEQRDGRGNDARVVEDAGDADGGGARLVVGVAEELDHRLDELAAELAQRVDGPAAHEARQRAREVDVALDDVVRIADADQDLQHDGARPGVAGGDEREQLVGELGTALPGHAPQRVGDGLLHGVRRVRELLDEQRDDRGGRARGQDF